jgi:uncharacterized membrane protein YccC
VKSQQASGISNSNLLSAICYWVFHSGPWGRTNWARRDLSGDFRVRHGIKLALSGLLALFCTQVLRVPRDSWAILTVMVLVSAQFVGAFAFKAVMRIAGTLVGAVVGVWLATDYASTPAIFLPVFFLVMALAGYNFGHIGARQVPYAYFLLGLTTLAIATSGVTDPGQAWQTGLDRTEEIVIGILCALLVSTLVWPRYARAEFVEAIRPTLNTIKQLVSVHARAYIDRADASDEIQQLQHDFDEHLSRLRSLLQAGARESTVLSARLPKYNAFMVALTHLFDAALDFSRHRGEPVFLKHARRETELLFAAVSDELDNLLRLVHQSESLSLCDASAMADAGGRMGAMNEAFAAFEVKVNQIRSQEMLHEAPLQTAIDFGGELAALRSIRDELKNLRSALEGLPNIVQSEPPKALAFGKSDKQLWDLLPTIDWFWIKVAIKGGLAVAIAILFIMWIHPPGAANVPVMAWTLAIMGRPFLLAGGTGDLRSFQTAFRWSLILAGCALLLLLTTPLFANYVGMSVALFLALFAFGFFTARIQGITFGMQIGYVAIPAFVGLNPQEPVASQTIIDTFVGLIFGIWIGTVVGRLLWPVLPQRILRNNLVAICAQMKALLNENSHPEEIRTRLTTLPVEALGAIRHIRLAGCSEEERTRLVTLVRSLQTLTIRISQLVSRRNLSPEITEQILTPQFERLEIEFKQMLDAFAKCFREGDRAREFPTLQGALSEMDHATQQIRDRNLLEKLPYERSLRLLDLLDRYHATAEALAECSQLIGSLRIARYWGDYGL